VAGSGDEEPPVGGQGGEGGEGEPEAGSGGDPLPEGGAGGTDAGQAGEGQAGEQAPPVLQPLEVTAFTIENQAGWLSLGAGDVALGSVTFRNPNDQPFPITQIIIVGQPPGVTHPIDLIPTLGGPTTIPGSESITYSASRTMLDTDPVGEWVFYTTWQDADLEWHDGGRVTKEVRAPLDQDWGTYEPEHLPDGMLAKWACWNPEAVASDGTKYPSCTDHGWQSWGTDGPPLPDQNCQAGEVRLMHLCPHNPMWWASISTAHSSPMWTETALYAPTQAQAQSLAQDFEPPFTTGTNPNPNYKGK
jgi:hypothetical protein